MTKNVVVIGAGVAGLTTAYLLCLKGYKVTVVARNLPGDLDIHYTSPWAGANWHGFAGISKKLQQYDIETYGKLLELAKEPTTGIWVKPEYNYFGEGANDDCWFKDYVKNFRYLSADELPAGIKSGFVFDSFVISTPVYLNYLLAKITSLGATYKRAKLQHISEARKYHHLTSEPDLIVNCTGLLASRLGGVEDSNVYPVRGQTLLVSNSTSRLIGAEGIDDYENEMLYVMPRKEGGTIIGGCFLENVWDEKPDPEMTKRIVKRALKFCPDLVENGKEIDIVRVNVGLRPFRRGGPRVEKELHPQAGKVVHNYGAGGAGYQSSFGMARHTVALVEEFLREDTSKL